jgi:hypothetical protein
MISILPGLQKGVTPVSERRGCICKSFMFMLAAVGGNNAGWIITGQTVAKYKGEYGEFPVLQGHSEDCTFH